MLNNYFEHCINCSYNPKNGFISTKVVRAQTPLAVENNCSKTLLVFQAPGKDEWSQGRPLCSENSRSAAARIRSALKRLNLNRHDFNITNAVQCLPNSAASSRDKPPSANAQSCCLIGLKNDIELIAYTKIVVFGSIAKKSIYKLGYCKDSRFIFLRHPSGGLSNEKLDSALKPAM